MREATIGGLSDLDAVRPRKSGGGRSKSPAKSKQTPRRGALRRLRSRALLIVSTAGFSAILVGIVFNAIVLQKGHHPAPLFAVPHSDPRPIVRSDADPAPAPDAAVPALAPAMSEAADPAPAVHPAPPSIRSTVHATAPKAHPTARRPDPIAALLGGGAHAVPAHPRPTSGPSARVWPAVPVASPAQAAEPVQLHRPRPAKRATTPAVAPGEAPPAKG